MRRHQARWHTTAGKPGKGETMAGSWMVGRRVRVSLAADSEQGRLHAGEYGEIVQQAGTLEEGVGEYTVRLDGGELISLMPGEVEILDE